MDRPNQGVVAEMSWVDCGGSIRACSGYLVQTPKSPSDDAPGLYHPHPKGLAPNFAGVALARLTAAERMWNQRRAHAGRWRNQPFCKREYALCIRV